MFGALESHTDQRSPYITGSGPPTTRATGRGSPLKNATTTDARLEGIVRNREHAALSYPAVNRIAYLLLACSLFGCAPTSTPAIAPTPRASADEPSVFLPAPAPPATAVAPAPTAAESDAGPTLAPEVDFAALVSEEKAPCTSDGLSLRIPKQSSLLRCKDGFRDCDGEIPVSIDNCLDVDVTVESLILEASDVVGERASGWTSSKPWPTIPSGMRVTRNVEVRVGARYVARLTARSIEAGYGLSSAAGELVNTAYVAAKASCKACQGDWGPHGILQMEGCVCRARDRGKICHDADECEGACLYDHIERLGHGLGRNVGRCSELVGGFGCITYLHHGESKRPPRPLTELGPNARACAD